MYIMAVIKLRIGTRKSFYKTLTDGLATGMAEGQRSRLPDYVPESIFLCP